MIRTKSTIFGGILLAGAFAGFSAHSQAATLTGVVTYVDNRPAVNVTVVVAGYVSFTDVYGRYRIDNLPFGSHVMQIKKRGQIRAEITVEINTPSMTKDTRIPY